MCHEYPSSSIQRHLFYNLILLRFTRLSAKQFEAREEQRELLLKETVEKARSFHRERSSSNLILVRFILRYILFENRFLDPHFLPRFPLAIGRKEGELLAKRRFVERELRASGSF